ncbi:hypothetical protein ABIF63_001355 [Bradyrhizobium japonicum]|uniref:Uncharacterized protein n=1 Tax=Bradyrhizobium japonicum TaxID=375 RepID=A0ABV2RLX0_BRAJP
MARPHYVARTSEVVPLQVRRVSRTLSDVAIARKLPKNRIPVDNPSPAQIDLDCNPDEVGVIFSAELGLQHGGRVGNGFIGDAEFGRDF